MACRLLGAKPLSEPMLAYCILDPTEHILMNFFQNSKVFIQGNTLENVVCVMAAILSRLQYVNSCPTISCCHSIFDKSAIV